MSTLDRFADIVLECEKSQNFCFVLQCLDPTADQTAICPVVEGVLAQLQQLTLRCAHRPQQLEVTDEMLAHGTKELRAQYFAAVVMLAEADSDPANDSDPSSNSGHELVAMHEQYLTLFRYFWASIPLGTRPALRYVRGHIEGKETADVEDFSPNEKHTSYMSKLFGYRGPRRRFQELGPSPWRLLCFKESSYERKAILTDQAILDRFKTIVSEPDKGCNISCKCLNVSTDDNELYCMLVSVHDRIIGSGNCSSYGSKLRLVIGRNLGNIELRARYFAAHVTWMEAESFPKGHDRTAVCEAIVEDIHTTHYEMFNDFWSKQSLGKEEALRFVEQRLGPRRKERMLKKQKEARWRLRLQMLDAQIYGPARIVPHMSANNPSLVVTRHGNSYLHMMICEACRNKYTPNVAKLHLQRTEIKEKKRWKAGKRKRRNGVLFEHGKKPSGLRSELVTVDESETEDIVKTGSQEPVSVHEGGGVDGRR